MKVLITGGTGFVGSALTKHLLAESHRVTVLGSRAATRPNDTPGLTRVSADTTRPGDWQYLVAEQDIVINLAGRTIFHLWTDAYKKSIRDSRVLTTRNLVDALPENSRATLFSASAAGYYGDGNDDEKVETDRCGNDFLAEVCREWEAEARKAEQKETNVVIMRFGVVLGAGGGAVGAMKTPFSFGLGGPIGSGRQWFPWIHLDDLIQAICFLLGRQNPSGTYNFTAPGQVRQKDFAHVFATILSRPAILPAPSPIMKLVLGEFGNSLLQGQRAVPDALRKLGYSFLYPELEPALREILGG